MKINKKNKPCSVLDPLRVGGTGAVGAVYSRNITRRMVCKHPICALCPVSARLVTLLCSSIMFHDAAQLLRSCGRVSHDESSLRSDHGALIHFVDAIP